MDGFISLDAKVALQSFEASVIPTVRNFDSQSIYFVEYLEYLPKYQRGIYEHVS